MDIVLRTNCDDPALTLADVERFGDDSGYSAHLKVTSGGFAASKRFYFGRRELESCIAGLADMLETLAGGATLFQEHELDELEFRASSGGHVVVTGSLKDIGRFDQSFSFGFETDQTVLGPLIDDLRACLDMPVQPGSSVPVFD